MPRKKKQSSEAAVREIRRRTRRRFSAEEKIRVVLGASLIERHITLDRSMWGSDQSASIEPHGFARLVRDIRVVEQAMGDGVKSVYESDRPLIDRLRRVG